IKKGVMELADLVVINKADIDADAAMRAQAQITASLRLLGLNGNPHDPHSDKHWHPQVVSLSALQGQGVDRFWSAVSRFRGLQSGDGQMAARRQNQALAWMWERINSGLRQAFRQDPRVRALLPGLTLTVQGGQIAASTAARNLLAAHIGSAQAALDQTENSNQTTAT
ncbi:MAG: methylmalonyl Co-A mutase-associated GTPase MeaB, partial [Rhodoferax sp.]